MAEPCVRMSGTVLASLLFQHLNGASDVEGLILGEIRLDQQVTISDSQADQVHVQETYHVQKHVSFQRLDMLSSSSGRVNMEELHRLLAASEQAGVAAGGSASTGGRPGASEQAAAGGGASTGGRPGAGVLGWYRQRRNSQQQMSFREKLLHEDLKGALSNPHLLFLLLTPSQATPTGSTHKMEYSAFISRGRRVLSVPLQVSNLGLLEQQAYWKAAAAPCSAAGYVLAVDRHRFFSSDGQLKEVREVTRMNQTLQEELQRACRDVERSERQLETLQAEVSSLGEELRAKRPPPPPCPAGGADAGAAAPRDNAALRDAVAALFGGRCSPLLLTQTLSLRAFPVPRVAVETASSCRKRRREAEAGTDRKCRRSRC